MSIFTFAPEQIKGFSLARLARVAGIRITVRKCRGPWACDRGGDHFDHVSYEQKVIADPLMIGGRKTFLTIRHWNFLVALKVKDGDVRAALDYAEEHFFDAAGRPKEIYEKFGFFSYHKLLEAL